MVRPDALRWCGRGMGGARRRVSDPQKCRPCMVVSCSGMSLTVDFDVSFAGRRKNVRLANGEVELIVPTEIGPRVLRYARVGGPNVFGEIDPAAQSVATEFGDAWHLHGGHRLWYAPEHAVMSYFPDNVSVACDAGPGRARLTQPVEPHTGLEKCIDVELAAVGSRVDVIHRITNRGANPIELAPWALTVMACGGRAIFPHAPYRPHPEALAPARPLVLWPFTKMGDPRWRWGDRYLVLQQDPSRAEPQKVGFYDVVGWMAYALGDLLFVKRHTPVVAPHADFGCNVETFTNDIILELETLGPLVKLDPGASVVHREAWFLFEVPAPGTEDDAIEAAIAEVIASTGTASSDVP